MITAARFFGGAQLINGMVANKSVFPGLFRVYAAITTTAGLFYLLPDARTLQLGGPQLVLVNALSSTQSVGVKDNSGATIATIAAGEAREFYLWDKATAAGGWASRDL